MKFQQLKITLHFFIHNEDNNHNTLRIPQRAINFLSNKLRENGYDDSHKLLQKTHGLYYYIKIELFTGKLCHPGWERDNDKAVIVAALLGKWSECDGDKSVIEKLYGNSYDQFVSYLNQYIGVEDAFIVRKHNMSNDVVFEIADPFLAICSHRSVVNLPIIKEFLAVAKNVISERDSIFDEPFDKHYYLSAFTKTEYSSSIKSGMARTLILLALYADYQSNISYFVKDLLKAILSVKDWAYISQFIDSLCEAAPDAVVDCLEKNVDNHTGLLDLFTVEKTDFLMGRHYYTHILWCLERLLQCKDYAVKVVRILFELGEKIEKCSISNDPRDDLSKVFCTWYNVSALEIEEKIELARIGAEKYPFFWDILYNEIGKDTFISGNTTFTYREADNIVSYTNSDIVLFYEVYTKILISSFHGNLEKLVKLIDLLPNCTDELFVSIQKEMTTAITNLNDSDKEQIKTTLRKIIYRHRHYANSAWAAPADRVSKIEEICVGISFKDPAYDFLYLTESGETPIFNPVVYDGKEESYQKNNDVIKDVIVSEITRFKEIGIDLGHFLGLKEIRSYYNIGKAIAKYYCNLKYDQGILDAIVRSASHPQIAVDYVYNCSTSSLSEMYKSIEFLRKDHFADDFYVAFLSSLPFDEKSKILINELPEDATRKYWSRLPWFKNDSKDLLFEIIDNLIKYSNWNAINLIIHSQIKMFNTEELLTIISESTQKMIAEKLTLGGNDCNFIKRLFSEIHQRIGNDYESYPDLSILEFRSYGILEWEDMKCCQYLFKRDAYLFADILSATYKKDDGSYDEITDEGRKQVFFSLERDIKFCPGEENGSINEDILNKWISEFKSRLEHQKQKSLFYSKLGKLFACSPTGSDGVFPHEVIRDKIEELGNEELIESFALAIINRRGVYMITGGKAEFKLGQKYAEISQKLSIRYPKTASIFKIISNNYFNESERDRKIAETEIY